MYEYLRGTLVEKSTHTIVLDVNGIGYKIHVPINILHRLPATNQQTHLFISFVIRENAQTLFGFFTKEDRAFFEQLNNISGIGPKTALALIGHLDAIDFTSTTSLCRVPGIGKKTAERILLEIKDKLPIISTTPLNSKIQDALSALIHLGYSKLIAEKALKGVNEEEDLSSIITQALRNCT